MEYSRLSRVFEWIWWFDKLCFHFSCWMDCRCALYPWVQQNWLPDCCIFGAEARLEVVLTYCNITFFMPLPLIEVKVKVRTLDIVPLHSESPSQKCSGMACVLKGFHSFTCTPTRPSAIGMSHTCLCFASRSWYSLTDRGGMEGWVDLGAK